MVEGRVLNAQVLVVLRQEPRVEPDRLKEGCVLEDEILYLLFEYLPLAHLHVGLEVGRQYVQLSGGNVLLHDVCYLVPNYLRCTFRVLRRAHI